MKKSVFAMAFAAAVCGSFAQETFRAGQGVANGGASNVEYVTRGAGNPYGYGAGRSYWTPLGVSLVAWDLPNSMSVVDGVRLNFGCGRFERTNGLDVGLFSRSGDFCGVAANLIGNFSEHDVQGLQVGVVNMSQDDVCGVQIGLVNKAGRLRGMQIGLVNFNPSGISFPVMNFGF